MKKHLIAAAVAAAVVAPAAMAQSTVEISGTLDIGYQVRDIAGTGAKTGEAVRNSAVNDNMVATPVITFRGSEDLGGGLKANFRIAQEFDVATGAMTDSGASFTYAEAGLSGGFGAVAAGRFAHATRDAGGVYRFFGDIGRLPGVLNSNARPTSTAQYVSPAFGGVTLSIADSDIGKTSTDTEPATRLQSFGIRGSVAGIALSVGQENEKNAAGGKTLDLLTIAANYDFKVARVGLIYADNDTNVGRKLDALGVHVAVPLGGPWTIGGSFTKYDSDTDNGGTDVYTLAARYALSKRTSIFASYQNVDADAVAAGIGSTRGMGVAEIAGKKTDGFGISVVHTF